MPELVPVVQRNFQGTGSSLPWPESIWISVDCDRTAGGKARRKHPSTKLQHPEKHQAPVFEFRVIAGLEFGASLMLGVWLLELFPSTLSNAGGIRSGSCRCGGGRNG